MPPETTEPLQLLYRNGIPEISSQLELTKFSDISLTKESLEICQAALREAENRNRPIQNQKQLDDYIQTHSLVDSVLKRLRQLVQNDREPWKRILSQIAEAITPMEVKLINASGALRQRITIWRQQEMEGLQREAERLSSQAAEKRAEAKYSEDPKKRRQANVEAKQLEKEVRKTNESRVVRGMDTEKYYEATITNRQQAAVLPEQAIQMDPNQEWFNRETKARIKAGEKFSSRMFRGVELVEKTRVRFHR